MSPLALGAALLLSFISERDGNREVYVIQPDGQGERRLTKSPDADYNGPLTPDGKYLLVTSVSESDQKRPQRFWLHPLSGGTAKPLGPVRSVLHSPQFSSDGKFLFFEGSSTGLREVFRLSLDGQRLNQLTSNRQGNFQPSLSPTGDRVVFVSSRDQVAELYLASSSGGPAKRLTQTERDEWQPQWSSDGKLLLFGSDREGADRLYTLSLDGNKSRRVTTEPLDPFTVEESASFSPDGKRVLYVHRQRGHKDKLCIVELATQKRLVLYESKTDHATEPVFSPDGKQVAFTLGLGGQSQIYIIDSDGKNLRRLTTSKGPNWHPLWTAPPSGTTQRR
ncbi:MAG: PD40 domain-containing protein [Myxococcales bacterium]|nr:PD40 domain-containing protein [Myxococcales bacterium]